MMSFPFSRREALALPGGGFVSTPAAYKIHAYKDATWREAGLLVLYRHLRSMMSGTSECDGMIAVARHEAHPSIDDFVNSARGALTTRWAYGDEQGWGDTAVRLLVERREGEISGPLLVHVVGFWDVYDWPGRFLAVEHARRVRVAVWIWDKHGGEKRARTIVNAIGDSYRDGAGA